ncbi:MAG: type II toxin-antitoxin system VapC family toxin [Desulfatitalea sp.]
MILDTCALLWLASGDHSRFSEATLAKINRAPYVFVSAISGFEIGVKYKAGKLRLPVAPQAWLDAILQSHQIEVFYLDLETCIYATELPPIHKDPCDRLIIASALTRAMPVVTSDTRFSDYGVHVLL